MSANLASRITKAASKQTYYTIRFLVDSPRMDDAYRAYAYFRWLDDVLDRDARPGDACGDAARRERTEFLDRQRWILDESLRGAPPRGVDSHEAMLVDLVGHAGLSDAGLETYLRHMMLVMAFDVRRRGHLVSQTELDDYTRWLAIAVTEAMHHFIGNGAAAPCDSSRYLAVSGAHILHMLRDTYPDIRAGYFNVPRELLESRSIGPEAVQCDAYRGWVAERVDLARTYLAAGRTYFRRVENVRHRIAGLAYIARFEWLIEALERDDFRLRPHYEDGDTLWTQLRMGSHVVASMLVPRVAHAPVVHVARRHPRL